MDSFMRIPKLISKPVSAYTAIVRDISKKGRSYRKVGFYVGGLTPLVCGVYAISRSKAYNHFMYDLGLESEPTPYIVNVLALSVGLIGGSFIGYKLGKCADSIWGNAESIGDQIEN